MRLNVNSDALVKFTNNLEKLGRSAFPVAIRSTLNDAAFNLKTDTMPIQANETFMHRQQNFFKANSKFEKATGFDINTMQSNVGFYQNKLRNQGTNYAVQDLEQQEYGGHINGKSLIAMTSDYGGKARVGGYGIVRPNARMKEFKGNIINAKNVRSISGHGASSISNKVRKQKLIRAAIKASRVYGDNAYILGNPNASGGQTLFKVNEVYSLSSEANRRLFIKLTALYRVKKGRSISVKPTAFMQHASVLTSKKMDNMFIEQATRQFKKAGILK